MRRVPTDARRVSLSVRVRPDVLAYLRSHDGVGVGEAVDRLVDLARGLERRYGVHPAQHEG